MNPLALALIALAASAAQPEPAAPVPPAPVPTAPAAPAPALPPAPPAPNGVAPAQTGGTTVNTLPGAGPPSAVAPRAGPVPDSPFGFIGPFPFAPNPYLADGYSRPLPELVIDAERRRFQSDPAFDTFVGPVTNPILAKDPRAGTFARMVFVNNNFPGRHPYRGGAEQFYVPQASVAVSERWAFSLDKAGAAMIEPRTRRNRFGDLNMAFGAKYTFYREFDCPTVAAAGLMYEIPTGDTDVFQGQGSVFTPYLTAGRQFADHWHVLGTAGLQAPASPNQNSTFFYQSLHLDRAIDGWFYPLMELNYFQYVKDGEIVPQQFGEGDGLVNYGSQFNSWKQFLSFAVGAKFVFHECVHFGAAYEIPLSTRKDILNNRVTVELLIRY